MNTLTHSRRRVRLIIEAMNGRVSHLFVAAVYIPLIPGEDESAIRAKACQEYRSQYGNATRIVSILSFTH